MSIRLSNNSIIQKEPDPVSDQALFVLSIKNRQPKLDGSFANCLYIILD